MEGDVVSGALGLANERQNWYQLTSESELAKLWGHEARWNAITAFAPRSSEM